MKYEERLTQWVADEASLILDNPTTAEEARQQVMVRFKKACIKLAELEDKIEAGELVDRDEYIGRLMAAKDISGMTDKELEFFAKHNAKVRKEAVKGVLLTMLDRMDRLTGCGVPYHVKKFINDIAEENGVDFVEEY